MSSTSNWVHVSWKNNSIRYLSSGLLTFQMHYAKIMIKVTRSSNQRQIPTCTWAQSNLSAEKSWLILDLMLIIVWNLLIKFLNFDFVCHTTQNLRNSMWLHSRIENDPQNNFSLWWMIRTLSRMTITITKWISTDNWQTNVKQNNWVITWLHILSILLELRSFTFKLNVNQWNEKNGGDNFITLKIYRHEKNRNEHLKIIMS